ncbi:unnamed protein product [Caenorhabditis bovis]|uniref:Large ribosomal subunit protein mL50 n=1 Tax=Caenorhabditis bovis TaxID=2654633 RepID=A0A8S1EYH0_9PELO|nr:unnamed protein product [Caenorhabditis bovis]
MQRSIPRLIRNRGGFLKGVFSGGKTAEKSLTVEERERLQKTLPSIRARESTPTSATGGEMSEFDADELLDNRIDTDAIRARGFLKYKRNYVPSADVKREIREICRRILSVDNIDEFRFEHGDNSKKFEILRTIGEKIGHWPNNGKLVHLKSIGDIVEFYETPYKNITPYSELARDEKKPKNVHVLEQAVRFHPEDTHMYHGGVTAFPGTGGEVLSLRQKRLLRQFNPKKEWFDYEDQTFDYKRHDSNMPWDPEIAEQMDRYTDKRYNLKTKQFSRIRQ